MNDLKSSDGLITNEERFNRTSHLVVSAVYLFPWLHNPWANNWFSTSFIPFRINLCAHDRGLQVAYHFRPHSLNQILKFAPKLITFLCTSACMCMCMSDASNALVIVTPLETRYMVFYRENRAPWARDPSILVETKWIKGPPCNYRRYRKFQCPFSEDVWPSASVLFLT